MIILCQCSSSFAIDFYNARAQIRRGKRDNLGTIFHITPLKRMLRPIIKTVSTRRDGSNERSQHMFLLKNKKKYL